MLDLIITGDRVVTPHGVVKADIGVRDGRIVQVAEGGSLDAADAHRIIDARGKIVMPGGIDPHVHCSWPTPSPDGGEDLLSGPPRQVSRGGAAWRHHQPDRLRGVAAWRDHCGGD